MSKRSLQLQSKKLREIEKIKPYQKQLAGFRYTVLARVYSGGTDTELLCKLVDIDKGETGWDVGTGTGLVALAMKRKGAGYVLATDKSLEAVRNAKVNSRNLGIKIDVRRADVFGKLKKRFDVVTFNPPFTDHPPRKEYQMMFWDKGNKATRIFFAGLRSHLRRDGRAFVCWSSFGSKTLLKQLAQKNKLAITHIGRRQGSDRLHYDVYKLIPEAT